MTKLEVVLGSLVMVACVGVGVLAAGIFNEGLSLKRESPQASEETIDVTSIGPSRIEGSRLRIRSERATRGQDIEGKELEHDAELDEDGGHDLVEAPEEQASRLRSELEVHVRKFEQERSDPKWSHDAALSLETSMLAIPNLNFAVADMECRNTVCLGNVSWKSGIDAFAEAQKIAEYPYPTNCGTGVYFTGNKGTNDDELQASVVFDCSEIRNGSP